MVSSWIIDGSMMVNWWLHSNHHYFTKAPVLSLVLLTESEHNINNNNNNIANKNNNIANDNNENKDNNNLIFIWWLLCFLHCNVSEKPTSSFDPLWLAVPACPDFTRWGVKSCLHIDFVCQCVILLHDRLLCVTADFNQDLIFSKTALTLKRGSETLCPCCLSVGLGSVQNRFVGRRMWPFTPHLHQTVEVSQSLLLLLAVLAVLAL